MKWIKIIVSVILISGVVGIGVLATLPYRMTREIDARIAAIKAQGDPVSGKDFIPHVPDSQNGAPIYERVFKITELGEKDLDKTSRMILGLRGRNDPKVLASAEMIVSRYRSVLPLIEEASRRPRCRFDTNWNDPPEAIIYPYLSKVRDMSRLLAQIAVVDAASDRMDDSMKSIGLNYTLSESVREEPTLIGFLTTIACISISSGSLKRSAQYGDIPEPQAHKLFDLLGNIDLQSSYMNAIMGERAQGLDVMERVRHHIIDIRSVGEPSSISVSSRRFGIAAWLLDVRSCADELFYIRYMNRVVNVAGKPYYDKIAQQVEREPDFPKYAIASLILMPVFTKSKQALYESMSTVAGDRVFLAVLAYKSKFGAYPSSLDEAGKKLGWKLPSDPMTGKGFRYRREGKGFILYGLGRNLKNDNAQTVEDLPESIRNVGPSDDRNTQFRDKYPYSTGTGRHSADMIWEKSR